MKQLPDERIYYAQNREDLIIESFFDEDETGFYVDVGACHPDVASVTKRFYLKGWRGINIEPQTNLFGLFERDRSEDLNLNIGISDKKGSLVLRSYTYNQGLSTIAKQVKNEHESISRNNTDEYEDIKIQVETLADIFKKHKTTSIQFLKVDVEGYEYQVLKGNDWNKYRPEVICIESNHVVTEWTKILLDNSYEMVFFDGLNEYYADSRTDRASRFQFVNHVVLKLKGGISADDYDKILSSEGAARTLRRSPTGTAQKLVNKAVRLSSKVRKR